MSLIRSPELAPEGEERINWVARHMPVLQELERTLAPRQPFRGLRIAICLHLEAKTAYLAKVLQRCGAEVAITASNPLSTQDAVAAALAASGIEVFAWHGATGEEYWEHLRRTAATAPHLVIDDGGDLITLLHREFPELLAGIRGGPRRPPRACCACAPWPGKGGWPFPSSPSTTPTASTSSTTATVPGSPSGTASCGPPTCLSPERWWW